MLLLLWLLLRSIFLLLLLFFRDPVFPSFSDHFPCLLYVFCVSSVRPLSLDITSPIGFLQAPEFPEWSHNWRYSMVFNSSHIICYITCCCGNWQLWRSPNVYLLVSNWILTILTALEPLKMHYKTSFYVNLLISIKFHFEEKTPKNWQSKLFL